MCYVMSRNRSALRSYKLFSNHLPVQSRTTIPDSDCDPRRSCHFLFCFCNPLPLHHSQERTLAPLQVRQSAFAQSNSTPTQVICAIKRKIHAIHNKKGASGSAATHTTLLHMLNQGQDILRIPRQRETASFFPHTYVHTKKKNQDMIMHLTRKEV